MAARFTALRWQRSSLGFKADAQFQHRNHVTQGAVLLGRNGKAWRVAQAQHEGADAVPCLHQARSLQLADGLANHGAADIEFSHDGRLGRQLVAGLQLAFADAPAHGFHQVQRQAAGTAAQGWLA